MDEEEVYDVEEDESEEAEVDSDDEESEDGEGLTVDGPPDDEDEDGRTTRYIRVVPPNERVTSDVMQRFEMAQIIAVRAVQIARTGRTFLPETVGALPPDADAQYLAELELRSGNCPLKIRRRVGEDTFEEWLPREMALPEA